MTQMPGISVFFPAYNDAGTIASMVISAVLTLETVTDDYEVIVVNDGSADHTAEILNELERKYERVKIVHHEKNRGYGGALRSGFENATKELIFYTDGDAQYDARELKLLVEQMDDGVDLVNGYKITRSDPLHRIVIGKLYQYGIRILFQLKLKDVDCDFRLMRRSIFDRVELKATSGVICVELMKKIQDAGFTLREVPVNHYHRAYGKSQFFNFPRVARTLKNLVQLWMEIQLPKILRRGSNEQLRQPLPKQERDDHGRVGVHRQQPRT